MNGAALSDIETSRRLKRWMLLCLLLGTMLLLAAGLKGYELATSPVAETDLPGSQWTLAAVVEYELVLGLWLLSRWQTRWAHRVALVTFSMFAVVTLTRALGGAESCGCFGQIQVNPWITLALDTTIVLALLLIRPHAVRVPVDYASAWRAIGAGVLALGLGVPAGWTMLTYEASTMADDGSLIGDEPFVILEPENWIGKLLPLVPHVDIGERFREGEWLVVLYRYDCGHCIEALPEYERLAKRLKTSNALHRLALVELPPFAPPGRDPVSPATNCVRGRLSDAREWFVQTPAILAVSTGQVTAFTKMISELEPAVVTGAAWSQQ